MKMSRLPMFFKGFTPEMLKKAEEELNETPQVKAEALKELKGLIKAQKEIFCNMDDEYLLRFLRVKKFNVQKSLQVLYNYINLHQRFSGVYTNRLPTELKNIMDMNLLFCQPHRLPDMSHITGLRLGLIDPNNFVIEDLVAFVMTGANIALEYEVAQISGVHLIADLADTTLHHYTAAFSINVIKFAVCALQNSFPMRVRGIYFVHESYMIKSAYNILKMLGSKKLTEKIHICGDDLNKLHQKLPKEFLPDYLGGTMNPIDNKEYASFYYSHDDLIEGMKKYKIVKKKS